MADSGGVKIVVGNGRDNAEVVEKLWGVVEQYQNELEEDNETKDQLRSVVRDMDKTVKKIGFGIIGMHSNPSDEKLKLLGSNAQELLKTELGPLIAKLEQKIPPGDYYKFNDHWRYSFQKICAVCVLTHYLLHGNLPTLPEVAAYIDIPPVTDKQDKALFLDYDEYLFGLLELANELSRLCRNIISFGGRADRAFQIHQLMLDLSAAMHNITFKNDYLRKKYDGLKYQLKTVEEVIYDLKLQDMKGTEGITANTTAENSAVSEKAQD